jgi:preprotein translocase subunit SecG
MLTFVFLMFVAFFLVSGVFISLEAKKRRDGSSMRASAGGGDRQMMGRATSNKD